MPCFALQLTELLLHPQLTVGALDGGDALGPFLPQHFLAHVEALQEDGHRHVHLHRLLVEQRRDAILEEFQAHVDGRLHRTGQRGAFACGEHIRITLNQLVLEDIRRNAYEAKTAASDYMQMLVDAKTEKQRAEIDRCKRELKKADKRIEELTKILNKLYEDVALEKISEERYQAMAPKYEQEQSELRGQREKLSAEIARNDEIYDNIQQFLPLIWKYTNVQELTPHILNELIEKIVVHEKEIGEDGVKTQQVDIYYKFIGCVNIRRAKADHAEIIRTVKDQANNYTA